MYREDHDEVRAAYSIMHQGVNIFIFKHENGKRYQVTNMEVDEVKPGLHELPPMITLHEDAAQELFNDLWATGFRPKKPEEYTAKDEHISDLRKVTFKLLGIS